MELLFGLVNIPTWLLVVGGIFLGLYWYCARKHKYFTKLGIPGPKPWPFIGNLPDFFKYGMSEIDLIYKKKYGGLVGTFNGTVPNLLVFDQDIILEIMVKQFDNFKNRSDSQLGFTDPILSNMLTNLVDDHWKYVRSVMSPTFTTGKLRQMADEINRSARCLVESVDTAGGPVDMAEISGNYALDVIASTAFGLRVDSQTKTANTFTVNARKIMDISLTNPIILMIVAFPKLTPILTKMGFNMFDNTAMKYFVNIVSQALNSRESGDKSRSDFIQLMSNLRQGHQIHTKEEDHEVEKMDSTVTKKGLTDDEILANAFIFFLAGFDTTSGGLKMLFYNLALNPECQQKVIEEVDDIVGGKEYVSYDDIGKMQYLDQCMHESLRLYPPAPRVDRVVKEDVNINGVSFVKDTVVSIPIAAMHRDSDIWPNPDQFDPDRFAPEEKAKRNPIYWQPFGYGPRICIGQRLATYEMKVAVANLLRKHKLVTCDKTENPIIWKSGKVLVPKNGIWLSVERRK